MSTLLEACLQVHFLLHPFWLLKTISGVFYEWYLALVIQKRMPWTLSVPFCQCSWISRLPFCYVTYRFWVDGVVLDLAGFAFVLFMAQPPNMRGSLRTWVGVKALPYRSTIRYRDHCDASWQGYPSCSQGHEIWRNWCCSRHSIWGGLWGPRPYRNKRASLHSCAPSSVPFTVDGCTVSHAPVFVDLRKRRASWTEPSARVSSRASSSRRTLQFCTSALTSWS